MERKARGPLKGPARFHFLANYLLHVHTTHSRWRRFLFLRFFGDRDISRSGVVVDFFGKPARVPEGVARLALRTGAQIVPAYGWRDHGGQFHARVLPALEIVRSGDLDEDVRVNLRRLLAVYEPIIAERPDQWMAFHSMWI